METVIRAMAMATAARMEWERFIQAILRMFRGNQRCGGLSNRRQGTEDESESREMPRDR
jgi:hypothetical protein